MTAYVYILGCQTPSGYRTYVGWTLDLERRLAEHNGGRAGAKSTRGRTWTIIYSEMLETRQEAMSREWHLKRDRRMRRNVALTAVKAVDPAELGHDEAGQTPSKP